MRYFLRNFRAVNGKTMRSLKKVIAFSKSTQQTCGYCDPLLWDAVGQGLQAALSPWTHIALLAESSIHRTIPEAIASLGDSPNIIWATGPSKTADVRGILIEGVHGPGEQIALCLV